MSRLAFLAVFVILAARAASAQQPSPAVREVCAADYHRLCPTVVPGGGRILRCLLDNDKDLSSKCRVALQQVNK